MVGEQDALETRDDLPKEFQAFWAELKVEISHPGDIATGARKGVDQSKPHRITYRGEDDGNLGSRLLSGLRRVVVISENDVHPVLHQLPCGGGKCGNITLREAYTDDKLLIL